MSVVSHVAQLRKKHETLSIQVERAQRSPSFDAVHIRDMKKEKLRLKEEIRRLT